MTYFVNKVNNIKLSISANLVNLVNCQCIPNDLSTDDPLLCFKPVTLDETLLLINALSVSKSTPLDIIPVCLLKSCSSVFTHILTELANKSLAQGKFPSDFKTAQITPLLKKPGLDPDDPASFRPISNLRTVSKILERLVHSRLSSHLMSLPGFSTFQSAYRPYHSTETALLKLSSDLFESSETGSPSILVSLDLSAAFDCIAHDKLIKRLSERFKVSGCALDWLISYLSNRWQYVKIQDQSSDIVTVNSGVPQGSVLGPLLFSAYVSPVDDIIKSYDINHTMYADDITLYISVESGAVDRLNNCLTMVSNFFMLNDLLLNPSKCEYLIAGISKQVKSCADVNVVIGTVAVPQAKCLKLLGVLFDSHLSFDSQISSICSSASYHLKALRHVRKFLDTKTANTVACAFIASKFDYCNGILSDISERNISRLQRIQNAASRVVLNNHRRDSATANLKTLHWLPIRQRIDFKVAVSTFKILKTGQPAYLHKFLTISKPVRVLRSASKGIYLDVPFSKTDFSARAFSSYAPRLWNCLPQSLRDSVVDNDCDFKESVSAFKRNLKTVLFTNCWTLGTV